MYNAIQGLTVYSHQCAANSATDSTYLRESFYCEEGEEGEVGEQPMQITCGQEWFYEFVGDEYPGMDIGDGHPFAEDAQRYCLDCGMNIQVCAAGDGEATCESLGLPPKGSSVMPTETVVEATTTTVTAATVASTTVAAAIDTATETPSTEAAATDAPDATIDPPDATIDPPDATIDPPDATIDPPDATIDPPDATIDPPDANIDPPDANIDTPDDGNASTDAPTDAPTKKDTPAPAPTPVDTASATQPSSATLCSKSIVVVAAAAIAGWTLS